MNKININSKQLSSFIKECVKKHIDENAEEWTSLKNGSDARFSHYDDENGEFSWGEASPEDKDFENEVSWNLSDIKDKNNMEDMQDAADDNYFDDSDFRFTTNSLDHPLREPMDVIDKDYDKAKAELESVIRENIRQSIKEALNEISFDTAKDAYYKSFDRAVDGFKSGNRETPKQAAQRQSCSNI